MVGIMSKLKLKPINECCLFNLVYCKDFKDCQYEMRILIYIDLLNNKFVAGRLDFHPEIGYGVHDIAEYDQCKRIDTGGYGDGGNYE